MKTNSQIETEIKKLRMVLNGRFSEEAKKSAWAMMLALEWAHTPKRRGGLSPMELSGITRTEGIALDKKYKRGDE